jgi:hypothetical protein
VCGFHNATHFRQTAIVFVTAIAMVVATTHFRTPERKRRARRHLNGQRNYIYYYYFTVKVTPILPNASCIPCTDNARATTPRAARYTKTDLDAQSRIRAELDVQQRTGAERDAQPDDLPTYAQSTVRTTRGPQRGCNTNDLYIRTVTVRSALACTTPAEF